MSAATEAAALDDATKRLTAGQRRAAMHVLDRRGDYASLAELADAIALAVLTAEDEKARRVIVLRSDAGLFVYGPYATYETALKVAQSGGLGLGGMAAIVGLTPAPKSPMSKAQTAPPRRPSANRPAA